MKNPPKSRKKPARKKARVGRKKRSRLKLLPGHSSDEEENGDPGKGEENE